MRIVQLIDSLNPGGAERMAVNYANALSAEIEFSGLIATRKEGALSEQLTEKVDYFFLNRTKTFDVAAIFRLRNYLKSNRIDFLHAHGTSFLLGVLVKLVCPRVKLLWHDHYGNRVLAAPNDNKALVLFSIFFDGVISCNTELEQWAKKNLKCKTVLYLPNFAVYKSDEFQTDLLKGDNNKRIVCLANLRHPKNHEFMVEAFSRSEIYKNGWTLHFIGADYQDDYSSSLKNFIKKENLEAAVFIYGSKIAVFSMLKQARIGLLGSTFEGFPVTLLEYGLAGLAVLSSDVGFCSEIINDGESGILFNPLTVNDLSEKLIRITNDEALIVAFGENLTKKIENEFSKQSIIEKYIAFLRKI
ncbi:glycosyltransferase [Flavobacterium sp. SM15]|uniref:glycosyltransferase n=1 Tax=Flavobacterium sp. SM15 TaxID=2908005 RepID=UPI001EDC6409|nr:glycosyltransferase [Flavobacterium sp. SM15]MCG2611246.1 glycosyltransferase [Flavobacterium sp. SM15]